MDRVIQWKEDLSCAEDRTALEEIISQKLNEKLPKTTISRIVAFTLHNRNSTNGEPFFTRSVNCIGDCVIPRTAVMHTFLTIFADSLKIFIRCKEKGFMYEKVLTNVQSDKVQKLLEENVKENFSLSGRSPFLKESQLRMITSCG